MLKRTESLVGLLCPAGPTKDQVGGLLESVGLVPVDLRDALESPGSVVRACVIGPDMAEGEPELWTQGLQLIEAMTLEGREVRGALLSRTSAINRTRDDRFAAASAAVQARWQALALRTAATGTVLNSAQVGLCRTWPAGTSIENCLLRQALRKLCTDSDVAEALRVLLHDVSYMTAQTIALDGGQCLGVIPPAGAGVPNSVEATLEKDRDLAGRVVVVVGASSGIGRELAKGLASRGANLVVAARRADLLDSLISEIRGDGGQACSVAIDARDDHAAHEMFDVAVHEFGRLDGLVYASATFQLGEHLLVDEQWRALFSVNLEAFMTHAVEFSRKREDYQLTGSSSIIAVSSIDAVRVPSKFTEAYSASKAGMLQCARSLANTLSARGIRVNVLLPGIFETDMTAWIPDSYRAQWKAYVPAGRLGKPEELIGFFAYLISDASAHVTGQAFIADGGFHLNSISPVKGHADDTHVISRRNARSRGSRDD